jgi:glycosyltransferase involved in cell wall biosynthesis
VKATLIISVYKNIQFLSKVLDSLPLQTHQDFEVIVAEDGDSPEMKKFMEEAIQKYTFPLFHLSQEDSGFRKNKSLNNCIRHATSDLIIFIDGDCILHPKFIYEYEKNYHEDAVLFSKRTNLDPKTTEIIVSSEQVIPTKRQMLFNKSTRIEDSFYLPFKPAKKDKTPRLMGCNMAIPKKILLAINGFDEDYESTGYGEDVDIEWRIFKAGFHFINLKHRVIQYHLYHERFNREEDSKIGQELCKRKQAEGQSYCLNGLIK